MSEEAGQIEIPIIPSVGMVRAEKARRSLIEFVRQAWAVIEPGSPMVEGWHHGAVCEHLEAVSAGQIRKLVISVPPEHSKSTIVAKCWPAWGWIDNPSFDWLFSAYSSQRSVGDSIVVFLKVKNSYESSVLVVFDKLEDHVPCLHHGIQTLT